MAFFENLFAFIFTLGILVTFHEYGHFYIARRCNVKVLRFSVGFGPVLYKWFDKQGTEFALSAIPLGGYVKMLDERESEVATHERHLAFNQKTVWQRISIVFAGPAANFLLAIVAFYFVALIGDTAVKPMVGAVVQQSISEKAGLKTDDQILAINGQKVQTWQDVNIELMDNIGETTTIQMTILRGYHEEQVSLSVKDWLKGVNKPDPFESLGFQPLRPQVVPEIDHLAPGLPAEKSGLQIGDRIKTVNGQPIDNWLTFVEQVKASPNQTLVLQIARGAELIEVSLTPQSKEQNGVTIGFIGAAPTPFEWPSENIHKIEYGVFGSIPVSFEKTWDMSVFTLSSIWKLITGKISVDNLAGPFTIAKVSKDHISIGLIAFLSFLALISINLGIINLLPIPMLDGGHLLYYFVEALSGRPVPESVQMLGVKIGFMIVMSVMFIAIYNDLFVN